MRINESRNFNEALRKLNPRFPIIETIHFFLVRNIKTELTQSHAEFRKLRRLEPSLWNNYLKGLGRISPENCIIYHWKAGGSQNDNVKDFTALAFFRSPRYHIPQYVLAIVILGAIGSSLQSLLTLLLRHWKIPSAEDSWGTQAVIDLLLLVLLLLIWLSSVELSRPLAKVKSRVNRIPFFPKR